MLPEDGRKEIRETNAAKLKTDLRIPSGLNAQRDTEKVKPVAQLGNTRPASRRKK